jgi:hypothetical protein
MNTKELAIRLKEIIQLKMPDSFLGQGISRSVLEFKIEHLRLPPLPQSLIDLFDCMLCCPNCSITTEIEFEIIPYWWLVLLDGINPIIDFQLELSQEYNPKDLDLFANAIPFLCNAGGDSMWVKNQNNDNSIWYKMKELEPERVYESIDHFLLTAITCYEREAYHFYEEEDFDEEEDFLLIDIDMESEIIEELRHLFLQEASSES